MRQGIRVVRGRIGSICPQLGFKRAAKCRFTSEADACLALGEALVEYEDDRPVRRAPDTVGGFLLDLWLRGIRQEVAESALSNYSTIVATYVVPRIGDVRLSRFRRVRSSSCTSTCWLLVRVMVVRCL